ncbi:MAG: hypothetical protein WBQ44_20800 [Rhodococcus sp. (in: high G+C Gram-positive bacteria)]
MNTAVWIVIAVVVVLLIVAIALAVSRKQQAAKRVEANRIREQAAERQTEVEQRQAVADESAAKARRAQADAEAKAAEARKLSLQAETHQGHAATSRDELDSEYERANKIDPDVKNGSRSGDVDQAHAEKVVGHDDRTGAHEAHGSNDHDGRSAGQKVRDTLDPRRDTHGTDTHGTGAHGTDTHGTDTHGTGTHNTGATTERPDGNLDPRGAKLDPRTDGDQVGEHRRP